SEVVVVTTFHIDLEAGGGDMHICLPYSMVEPIRDLLDAGIQSDRGDRDERWEEALKEEIMEARLELSGHLCEVQITMKELATLAPGDIIPIELPELVEVQAAEVPIFRGRLGMADGNYAVKVQEWIEHRQPPGLQDLITDSGEETNESKELSRVEP
ncbi:MAG TPA: flagellar motor switch protein FliM, partial [Sedimenticola sp.]|nr:flagellar motor switch protein FliM [Sedimenticola sp.]